MTAEPDMENLLASIRQAIDNDLGEVRKAVNASSASGAVRGSMQEMRLRSEPANTGRSAEITKEINELRSKIGTQRAPGPPLSLRPKTPFAQIMAGSLSTPLQRASSAAPPVASAAEDAIEAEDYPGESDGHDGYESDGMWREQAYLPAPGQSRGDGLISGETAEAANSSFNELADALMERALGERSVEDMTLELLRSMLRNWLDMHLPGMVERMVREEIERVARRGR